MTFSSELYPHQEEAFRSLYETGHAFFRGRWQQLPLKPRFARFLTGPTGTGKSFLVRAVAQALEKPLFEIGASNWLPFGSHSGGGSPTWITIATFLRRNSRGIIFIDELDKINGASSWMNHIRVEIFSLLDQRLPDTLRLVDDEEAEAIHEPVIRERLRARLAHGILVIGAGAFQDLHEAHQQRIAGFNTAREITSPLAQNDMAKVIPREIANRFSAPILHLPPLQERDYRQMLEQIAAKSPAKLRALITTIGQESLPAALAAQSGCRWLEEVLLEALIRSLPSKTLIPENPLNPQT